jgi:hypothetical protein
LSEIRQRLQVPGCSGPKKRRIVMLRRKLSLGVFLLLTCVAVSLSAQQAAPAAASAVVPPVMKFSGVLTDVNNTPLTGPVGVTFSLYKESQGGTALWVETQNVAPDKAGHYTVMLGSNDEPGPSRQPICGGRFLKASDPATASTQATPPSAAITGSGKAHYATRWVNATSCRFRE